MGKTALATNIAYNAALAYKAKQLADGSVEVDRGGKGRLSSRSRCRPSSSPPASFLRKRRSASDKIPSWRGSRRGLPEICRGEQADGEHLPLFIDDTPALSISALSTRARRLKRQHGLGMIVIDYLQLLHPFAGSASENRVQEISDITRGLKALAKELNVPVLALSQLSRAVEQREDKRPQLADLRESGTIEQDADVVDVRLSRGILYGAPGARRPALGEQETWQAQKTRADSQPCRSHHRQTASRAYRHDPAALRRPCTRSSRIWSSPTSTRMVT